jgi:hypothetical protein
MSDVATIAQGDGSGISEPRRVVVRDEQAWRDLWVEHAGPGQAPPAVDFSSRMVAAVFAGDRPTPGYTVEIAGARQDASALALVVTESRPAQGMLAAQMIVTPFHIVTLPRFDGPVSFT